MTGINDLGLRDEVTDEIPSELPEQMGGSALPTLMPGISVFRIPATVAQCIEAFDEQEKAADGSVVYIADPKNPGGPSIPKVTQRIRVRFDKDNPLLVVGGDHDGQPVATSISNVPRNRAKKGDPPVKVADMTYLIRMSLADNDSKLSTPKEWVAALLKHAGKTFRVEHGLTAQCRPDKVKYVNDPNDPTNMGSIPDPANQVGCGQRYYTKDFRLPAASGGGFSNILYCKNPACQAKLRGFFQIERFLPPTAGQ